MHCAWKPLICYPVLQAQVENMNHFMTIILVFMGSPERLNNSDLRAKLAEALETFLPQTESGTSIPLLRQVHDYNFFNECC